MVHVKLIGNVNAINGIGRLLVVCVFYFESIPSKCKNAVGIRVFIFRLFTPLNSPNLLPILFPVHLHSENSFLHSLISFQNTAS